MGRGEERAQSALVDNTLQLHVPKDKIDGRFFMYFKAVINQSQGITRPLLRIPLVTHMQHMRLSIWYKRPKPTFHWFIFVISFFNHPPPSPVPLPAQRRATNSFGGEGNRKYQGLQRLDFAACNDHRSWARCWTNFARLLPVLLSGALCVLYHPSRFI